MGIFRTLFSAMKSTAKYGFAFTGMYTFCGYLYVQEIKHRLGDSEQCQKILIDNIKNEIKSIYSSDQSDINSVAVITLGYIVKILTFYARTWHYRQYEKGCLNFHRNVIQPILRNYENYGIFNNKDQMEKQIIRNQVNLNILNKIIHVKQLNMQLNNQFVQDYIKLIEKQIKISTGSIIGLSQDESKKIDLIYNYILKGEKYLFQDEKKYWAYKVMQNQTKKHNFNDVVFKILFI